MKDYSDDIDFFIKVTYIVPALSLVISTLDTITYWTVLDFRIIEYLTISYLFVNSIKVFITLIILLSVFWSGFQISFFIMNNSDNYLKTRVSIYILIILVIGYLLWISENWLKYLIISLGVSWLIFIVFWFLSKRFIEKAESNEKITTDSYVNNASLKNASILKKYAFLAVSLVFIFLIPIKNGYETANNVNKKINYNYVESDNLINKLGPDIDKYILLGKIGDNYFLRPDSLNSVIIKQLSDFKVLEIKHVNKGDSLSSINNK